VIDDIFVFDCVIHLHDMSPENRRDDVGGVERATGLALGLGEALRPLHGDPMDFASRVSVEAMYDQVFVRSPTDMAMAQVVPIFDWYRNWWAPVRLQYEMAAAYPDRVLFCGGVDPAYRGLDHALEQIDVQVKELGARSLKFYNGHVEGTWRCDDRDVAYPMYERCQALGIDVLQFHKGMPFGLSNVEDVRPNDLQGAARDFPDLTFVIHHLGMPYFDETVSIAARFPNVHLALSANLCFTPIAPRLVQTQLGRLLMEVGADKLLWGSEAALAGPPKPYLDAFLALEIPEDLRSGYGYPQITREDKRKILGLNFARMMGVEVPAAPVAPSPVAPSPVLPEGGVG